MFTSIGEQCRNCNFVVTPGTVLKFNSDVNNIKTSLFLITLDTRHCFILNQNMLEYKNKTKCVTVQLLMDLTRNTAPATLLAQSLFIIRNPRQVTNTLYHL